MTAARRLEGGGAAIAEGALLVVPLAATLFLHPESGFGPEADRALLLRALAIVAATGILIARVARGESSALARFRAEPVLWLAMTLFGLTSISTLLAPDPWRALVGDLPRLDGLCALAANLTLFLAARDLLRSAERRERLARALVVAGALTATYALVQMAGADPLDWGGRWPGRPVGAQANPVFLGGALVLLLPFAIAEAGRSFVSRGVRALIVPALVAAGLVAALLGARGRGALLGAAAGVVFLIAAGVALRGGRRSGRRLVAAAGVAAVASALALWLLPLRAPGLDPTVGTARQRMLVWGATLALFAEQPARLVFGWGPENLALVLPRHLPEGLPALVWESGRTQDRAHQIVLDTVATVGLLGLFAAAALAAIGIRRSLVRCGLGSGEPPNAPDGWLDAACAAALVGHMVELQFGFRTAATGALSALVLALATAPRSPAEARAARSPAPWTGASAGLLAGAALLFPALTFVGGVVGGPGARRAVWTLTLLALAAWLVSGTPLPARQRLGRIAPMLLLIPLIVALGGTLARRAAAPDEGRAWMELLLPLAAALALAAAVAERRSEARERSAASRFAMASLVPGAALLLLFSVARPLLAGVAHAGGRAAMERGASDVAAAAFARSAARAPLLVDPIRLEARSAARAAGLTTAPELRDRRFRQALDRLEVARARHRLDSDLDLESALIFGRWSERTADPALRRERLESARAHLETAAGRQPVSDAVQRSLAAVLLDLGEIDAALLAAERAERLAPRSLESALLVGRARATKGNLAGAVEALRSAARLDAERGEAALTALTRGDLRSISPHRDLALWYVARGQMGAAAAQLRRARALARAGELAGVEALEAFVAAVGAGVTG